MKRQVFFSFYYDDDNWRASQVRNMGEVDSSSTFSDNDWEEVRYKTDDKIRNWIKDQMRLRSCLIVLIGKNTSSRKWVKYEIEQAYEMGKGICGIYIHNLKDSSGNQSEKGANPFYSVFTDSGERLSKFVNCFDSSYVTSKYVYDDIKDNIENLIEEAISNKGTF
jgi:hypothetical protein